MRTGLLAVGVLLCGFAWSCGGAMRPVCTGGLCGQQVKSAKAGYIDPKRVVDVMDLPVDGKVTVIDFWETSCPPCIEAMPKWNELSVRMDATKAVMIAVSLDETIMAAREGVRADARLAVDFPMLFDGEALLLDAIYQTGSVRPVTVVVDASGRVVFDSRQTAGDTFAEVQQLLDVMGVIK